MAKHIDIHESEAAEDERKRQATADRSRRYRAAKKEEGIPDVKAVDQAISEAVSFLVSVSTTDMTIRTDKLTQVTTIILKREGYRKIWSRMAVIERMRPRPMHDNTTIMPSRRLTPTTQIIGSPMRGSWTDQDLAIVRSLRKT